MRLKSMTMNWLINKVTYCFTFAIICLVETMFKIAMY